MRSYKLLADQKSVGTLGAGALAELSKALLVRENKEKPKDPWSPPPPGQGNLDKRVFGALGIEL